MVSQLSMVFMSLTTIVAILTPICCFVYFYKTTNLQWKPVLVGAIIFFLFSQILGKSLNSYILIINSKTADIFNNVYLYALYGGISAAFFEEIGRFIGFCFLLKKYTEWKDGIAYGIGHGGVEAILIGGFTGIQNLLLSGMINSGGFDYLVKKNTNIPSDLLLIKEQLINTSSYIFLLGGIERISTFIIQILLSLLVLYGIKEKKLLLLFYAIIIHACIDFVMILFQRLGVNILLIEGLLLLIAIICWIVIKKFKLIFTCGSDDSINRINKTF
ncbi:YhfC family intramembrane metalloprotease [Bacillus mycoides]|uniref:YhfC family intramembrane metalloprotease n=1 Tax=Bacillus mycoides TaxID=1405 RepID=UPI0003E2AEE5|nr:YhfC family intramembrane metalloprotease [Bacillus mycoides]ETT84684.1 hypothetical protein C174_02299 [Bacillus mycoides FSL H7-687]